SGSQSTQSGNEEPRYMTSAPPSRSTATTSCVPQSENQRRPSCQRGCSPKTKPVMSTSGVCTVYSSRSCLLRLELAPAAGAVVGDDLLQDRCQGSSVDPIVLLERDRSRCRVDVSGGDDPSGSGTMRPS